MSTNIIQKGEVILVVRRRRFIHKKGDEMENDDGDNECGGVCYYYPKLDL